MRANRQWGPLLLVAALASSAGAPRALAQPTPASVPDSTLEALKGRMVTVTTEAGLSARGELVAFDDDTVSIVKADAKLAVIERGHIDDLVVETKDQPAPASAPGSVEETDGAAPASSPAPGSEERYEPEPGEFDPVRKGVSSSNRELSAYEQDLHVASGVQRDACSEGEDRPACRATLRAGAKHLRDEGSARFTQGIVSMVAGGLLLPFGAWQLAKAADEQDALDICEGTFGSTASACDEIRPGTHWAIGGALTAGSGVLVIVGGIFTAIGAGKKGRANDYLDEHRVALVPLAGPSEAGVLLQGRF